MLIDLFKVYFKLKLIPFKVKINTFKIKIEKCPENGKNEKKHVRLIHARIGPAHSWYQQSRPKPTVF